MRHFKVRNLIFQSMLRIAVQSKGRLFDDTMNLLAEADIKVSTSKRTLLVQASNFPLEVLFLRDDDIPQSVASGVADIGIVGENEYQERGENVQILSRLGFSKCRLSLALGAFIITYFLSCAERTAEKRKSISLSI